MVRTRIECTGYTKGSQYATRCKRCVRAAKTRCYQHPGVPGVTLRRAANAATVGNGVEVKATPSAGNGLFAKWAFRKGDIITEYSGDQMTLREAKSQSIQTHIARQATGTYMYGLRQPVTGQGGASFANHASPPNAERDEVGNTLYLKAKALIRPTEEITIFYGKPGSLSYKVAMGTARF